MHSLPAVETHPLTRAPIDLRAWMAAPALPGDGALASFAGAVRAERHPDGRQLLALEYSAYEPMAAEMIADICRRARAQFALTQATAVHRLGRLALGEASIAIVVSAPHRAAAFDGCRFIIERIKADVPIFKLEIWDRGPHTWVGGELDAPRD